jgi:acyl-CoA synthetase (NDP forming)
MAYSFSRREIGISRLVSSGNEADLRVEDYLELLEYDSKTRLIALYVEGIRDSHRFMEIAKRISRTKPILLLKGGTSPTGAQAARSHTGAMAGDDAIFRGMCQQTGIIQVDSTNEMVDISGILLSQPRISGNRVGIITLGGGWGVIATDYCASSGLELVPLEKNVIEMLDSILPPYWSRSNPIDLVAPNRVTLITDSINILLENTNIDAVFVLGLGFMTIKARRWLDSPVIPRQDIVEPAQRLISAERELFSLIVEHIHHYNKPIIPVMASVVFDEAMNDNPVKYFDRRGIMTYPSPEYAISAFTKAYDYYRRIENC